MPIYDIPSGTILELSRELDRLWRCVGLAGGMSDETWRKVLAAAKERDLDALEAALDCAQPARPADGGGVSLPVGMRGEHFGAEGDPLTSLELRRRAYPDTTDDKGGGEVHSEECSRCGEKERQIQRLLAESEVCPSLDKLDDRPARPGDGGDS
jgi:hypothetical protein